MKKLDKKKEIYETIDPLKYDTRFQKIPFYELGEFRLYQKLAEDLLPAFSILEVGCGTGRLVKAFPNQKYWGIDISKPLLAFAQKKYKKRGRSFLVLDYQKNLNRLPKTKFDLILLIGTFESSPDPVGEASILLDKAAAGGKIIFTCWNKRNLLARLFNLFEKERSKGQYYERTYFGLGELKEQLGKLVFREKVSFEIASQWVIPTGLSQKLVGFSPRLVSRLLPAVFSFLEAINSRLCLGFGSDWVVTIKKK